MIKIGDIIIPIRNTNGHNYVIGRKYRITQISGNSAIAVDVSNGVQGNNIPQADCRLAMMARKEINREIKNLESELNKLNKMVEFITETKKESILVNEFITWYLLKTINSDDKDKFHKISKILNTISNNISVDLIKHV